MERVKIGKKLYVSVDSLQCGKHLGLFFELVDSRSSTIQRSCVWDRGVVHTFLTMGAPVLHQYIRNPVYNLVCSLVNNAYVYVNSLDDDMSIGIVGEGTV